MLTKFFFASFLSSLHSIFGAWVWNFGYWIPLRLPAPWSKQLTKLLLDRWAHQLTFCLRSMDYSQSLKRLTIVSFVIETKVTEFISLANFFVKGNGIRFWCFVQKKIVSIRIIPSPNNERAPEERETNLKWKSFFSSLSSHLRHSFWLIVLPMCVCNSTEVEKKITLSPFRSKSTAMGKGKRHSDIAYDDEKSDFYGTFCHRFCACDVYSSAFILPVFILFSWVLIRNATLFPCLSSSISSLFRFSLTIVSHLF